MMFAEQLPIDPPTAGRPRLLDLCCGEQGAGVGYSRAGFDVTGVDLSERAARRAPLPFILGDAVAYLAAHGHEYDAVHVSPPCPAYSVATPATHRDRHPRLIEPLRELLVALGKPYVIENVVGAPLLDPVMLCGSMFGVEALDDDGTRIRLERHRLFESNVAISAPGPCAHDKSVRVAGLYGGGSEDRTNRPGRGGYTPSVAARRRLAGTPWMSLAGVGQSIPPVYAEHLGRQLLALCPALT